MRTAIVAALTLVAAVAVADTAQVKLTVDQTVEINVGYGKGLRCDDLSIIDAQLITRDDTNYLVVKGLTPGTTQCSVGTGIPLSPVRHLFEFVVRPKT